MVTLELPEARRLAMSVVLGQVVITVVAAAICFARLRRYRDIIVDRWHTFSFWLSGLFR